MAAVQRIQQWIKHMSEMDGETRTWYVGRMLAGIAFGGATFYSFYKENSFVKAILGTFLVMAITIVLMVVSYSIIKIQGLVSAIFLYLLNYYGHTVMQHFLFSGEHYRLYSYIPIGCPDILYTLFCVTIVFNAKLVDRRDDFQIIKTTGAVLLQTLFLLFADMTFHPRKLANPTNALALAAYGLSTGATFYALVKGNPYPEVQPPAPAHPTVQMVQPSVPRHSHQS